MQTKHDTTLFETCLVAFAVRVDAMQQSAIVYIARALRLENTLLALSMETGSCVSLRLLICRYVEMARVVFQTQFCVASRVKCANIIWMNRNIIPGAEA